MPLDNHNIDITIDNIVYAEKILLGKDEHFDDERKDFIKNLDTIDLQAVPGSGKTTALLAKLIILESKMPFSNGSGILVLSHTNTAVDEIKDRLGKIAPKLFQFPNFIGTIQSFVDEFLTKPYLIGKGINIDFIDSERQRKVFDISKINYFYNGINTDLKRKLNNILFADSSKITDSYLSFENENKLFFNGSELIIKKPKGRATSTSYVDWDSNTKKDVYNGIIKLKYNIISNGILSYEDAYFVGFKYLHSFPKIIKILQKRFQFVFVDEMQDMEKHQVDILEKIFYKKHVLKHCFQRIGDKNQAIYNGGDVKIDSEWKGGHRKELYLKGTHRLTQSVANVAKNFGVEFIDFDGQRVLEKSDGTNSDIKPIMLVYKTEHLNNEDPEFKENIILKKFTEIICEKKGEGYFSDVKEDKFICKAIIWNAKPQDDSKTGKTKFDRNQCRAKHYFFDYDVEGGIYKNKSWLKTEKDYLFYYDKVDPSYKSKNHNIWRLLLRILRENDIKNPETGKLFSRKETLLEFLKKNHQEKNFELKSKIYDWTKRLSDANIDEIAKEMDDYYFDDFIPSIFSEQITGKSLTGKIFHSRTTRFINIDNSQKELNIFENNGVKVNIGTVHGVKGETHTCTLYLETTNSGYEYNKIKEKSFLGTGYSGTKIEGKKAMKMLYVGLSRPTHLLCYAIHEDRYNQLISGTGNKEKLDELWQVKELQP